MKASDFFRKIFSARLWANLLLMLVVVVALCLGVKIGIDVYTNHGKVVHVPDLTGKSFADAEQLAEAAGLHIVVSDTGYVKTLPPDCILGQTPDAGRGVKPGRVIRVVVNASHSLMVTIPDIIDNSSYRNACARLKALGFKIGPTEYVPGEKDFVYGLKANGRNVQNGERVSVDDVIVIQVGNGMRDVNDSVEIADPELYFGDDADSTDYYSPAGSDNHSSSQAGNDVDEFEVVTGP